MLENSVSVEKPVGDVVISVSHVSKTYKLYPSHQDRLKEALHPFRRRYHEEFSALNDVSFEIRRGESVGILGRNGAGKSTLLQLISGVITPSSGRITVSGKVAALLELGTGFNPDLTGRENVVLASTIQDIDDSDIGDRVALIESFADIGKFFDQPMKIYSSGMYARVAFANAIHVDPDLLIVDEILGVGDAKFQEKCYRKLEELKARGVSILFVSHSVNTVLDVCDLAILLDNGRLELIGKSVDVVNAYHGILYGSSAEPSVTKLGDYEPFGSPSGEKKTPNCKRKLEESYTPIVNWLINDTTLVERFSTRLSFNKDYFRSGDGKARILDYIVVSGEDTDARLIRRGASVEIHIKVLYAANVPRPIVGMAISTIDGIRVYGTNSNMKSLDLAPGVSGQFCVYCFRFTNMLAGGDYFMNVGVATIQDDKTIFLDNLRSVAHIIVEHTPDVTGLISMENNFEEIQGALLPDLVPVLIEVAGEFNLVSYRSMFYGIPKVMPVDWEDAISYCSNPAILKALTISDLKATIAQRGSE
jgi:lipopolysaccharide transport system ATP-binding protein